MKTRLAIAALIISLVTLTSCKSSEERAIDRLQSLSERIEDKGSSFDADDWADALEELSEIHEDILDCEFTPEQLKALGKAEGQLAAIITKEGSQAIGSEVSNVIKNIGAFASGFMQGAEENISQDDINNMEEDISNALKTLEESFK